MDGGSRRFAELWLSRERGRVMWKSILAIDFNCGKYAKDLDTTETLRHNCVDVSIRDGPGPTSGDNRTDSA